MSGFRWWLFCKGLGAAIIVSALLTGFFAPYWRHADQDLALVYEGLLYVAGLPQEYFDHPGHVYFLIIGEWFSLLARLGLTPVRAVADLPPADDAAAFNAAWQWLVESGRALSALLGATVAVVFAHGIKMIYRDARLAALAGIALASGMGIMTQARQLRTEMASGGFIVVALLAALWATRQRPGWRPLAALALAGACCALALAAKVQAIFLIMALPLVLTALGDALPEPAPSSAPSSFWASPLWAGAALLAAGAALIPAFQLAAYGLAHFGDAVHPYKPLGGGLSGVYQGIVAGWGVLGMMIYVYVWRIPAAYGAQALAAVAAGLGVGLTVLWVRYNPQNVIAVVNFVEHMFVFSSWRHGQTLGGEAQVLSGSLLGLVAEGALRTLAIRTVVLHPDNLPPTLIVEWFVIYAAIKAWRADKRREAMQAAAPLLISWGLEAVFSLRGFQRAYAIYTDPLVIVAAVAALRAFPEWLDVPRLRRRVYVGLALLAALGHVWPVVSLRRSVDPAAHCYWLPTYLPRVDAFPFCPAK